MPTSTGSVVQAPRLSRGVLGLAVAVASVASPLETSPQGGPRTVVAVLAR